VAAGAPRSSLSQKARRKARATRSWAGYCWFMTGGTFLHLPIFLGG
jgi:hypothetical protein